MRHAHIVPVEGSGTGKKKEFPSRKHGPPEQSTDGPQRRPKPCEVQFWGHPFPDRMPGKAVDLRGALIDTREMPSGKRCLKINLARADLSTRVEVIFPDGTCGRTTLGKLLGGRDALPPGYNGTVTLYTTSRYITDSWNYHVCISTPSGNEYLGTFCLMPRDESKLPKGPLTASGCATTDLPDVGPAGVILEVELPHQAHLRMVHRVPERMHRKK